MSTPPNMHELPPSGKPSTEERASPKPFKAKAAPPPNSGGFFVNKVISLIGCISPGLQRFVSRYRALQVVHRLTGAQYKELTVTDIRPLIYMADHGHAIWYVYAPWGDGKVMIRGCRVLAISQLTGDVLYDGSANDEG